MSRFAVPVLTLETIEPHPHADRLELAVVGGFRAVVAKGSFTPGARVAYLPTDSVLPSAVAEPLGVATYLTGREKNRVKAIKLRGVLSEGIVVPLSRVAEVLAARDTDPVLLTQDGADLAPVLGITKYEEPIPIAMQGQARAWPNFVPTYDIENVKRPEFRQILVEGEPVVLLEKRHGSNMTVAWGPGLADDEPAYVCSRGHALQASDSNLYWLTARRHGLIEKLAQLRAQLEAEGVRVTSLSLHGETLGCQDLRYGASPQAPGFEAFDLRVNGEWVDFPVFVQRCAQADIPMVPVLYEGPYVYALLDGHAEGTATGHAHLREGVVIRPRQERTDVAIGRVQLKYVAGSYLTRGGSATELR